MTATWSGDAFWTLRVKNCLVIKVWVSGRHACRLKLFDAGVAWVPDAAKEVVEHSAAVI